MTQKEIVLKHLKKHKYIDRAVALNQYLIFNLPDVIMKLRKDGYNIENVEKKGSSGEKWVKYTLVRSK